MTVKLTIENANEDLIKAIKSIVKVANAEIKITKEKIPAWLKEAKDMEKNPHKYKTYKNVDEMFEDILKWNTKFNILKNLGKD